MLTNFYRDEAGHSTIEYALIVGFVALGLIVALVLAGGTLGPQFTQVGDAVGGAS